MSDPVTEDDLHAYVDDQLDPARRIEVEDHLARYPEIAARVMADLKDRDALRLAFATELPRPAEPMLTAARQLQRGLAWRAASLRLRRLAAMAALIALGWFAHGHIGLGVSDSVASPKPPAFVDDALHAHNTALVRARMASQREVVTYDPAEILAETGIALPAIPADWRVQDVQVFPLGDGFSIEMVLDAGDLGPASFFAAHVPVFNVIAPTLAGFDTTKAVFWQTGPLAYALVGAGTDRAMQRAAVRLADKTQ